MGIYVGLPSLLSLFMGFMGFIGFINLLGSAQIMILSLLKRRNYGVGVMNHELNVLVNDATFYILSLMNQT